MRIKSRWNKRAKKQSLEDIAGALGFISWKIATNGVLELENKGYQTVSNAHRLQIVGEFLAFLLKRALRTFFFMLHHTTSPWRSLPLCHYNLHDIDSPFVQ